MTLTDRAGAGLAVLEIGDRPHVTVADGRNIVEALVEVLRPKPCRRQHCEEEPVAELVALLPRGELVQSRGVGREVDVAHSPDRQIGEPGRDRTCHGFRGHGDDAAAGDTVGPAAGIGRTAQPMRQVPATQPRLLNTK